MAGFAVDEDRAELEILSANLRKTEENATKIAGILSGLDERLGRLEGTMKPIHRTTKRLWQEQSNVAATTAAIEKTRTYWNIPFEEESTIRAGPSADINRFLTAVRNLDQGLVTLQSTDLSSSQKIVNKTQELFNSGTQQLADFWQALLASASAPIEPLTYVLKNQPLPAFSRDQVETMRSIARMSSDSRGLATLKQQQQQVFIDLRTSYSQRSLQTFVLASQRNLELRTAALYERENNGIGHYTEALLRMSRAERMLCLAIFGERVGIELYERLIGPTFVDYCRACKAITGRVQGHLGSDCYLGFEVLEHVKRLNATVVDIELPETARELHGTLAALATITAGAFHELAEDLKRKMGSVLTLPQDGSVLDYIRELCNRLRKFCEYPEIVMDLLVSLGDGGWRRPLTSPLKLVHADVQVGAGLLDNFGCECVEVNLQILETKARTILRRPNQLAIFMLNNVTYVTATIKRDGLQRYFGLRTLGKLDDLHKRGMKVYRESCDLPARQLMDTTLLRPQDNKAKSGSMASKDREAVKERFRLFNLEFDELIRTCKSFSVADGDLKQQLTGELRAVLVPLYVRFYDKYVAMDFAKNKDKYIKYDKSSIEKVIWDAFA